MPGNTWDDIKNFLFGAGSLQKAAGQADSTPATTPAQNSSYLQSAIANTQPNTTGTSQTDTTQAPAKKKVAKKLSTNASSKKPTNSQILATPEP